MLMSGSLSWWTYMKALLYAFACAYMYAYVFVASHNQALKKA